MIACIYMLDTILCNHAIKNTIYGLGIMNFVIGGASPTQRACSASYQ
jgi:hypothetical protein